MKHRRGEMGLIVEKMKGDVSCRINASLERLCEVPVSRQIMSYQLGLGNRSCQGKMFRPLLCLLSCKVLSGSYKKALPAAVALELIHNFSLVHDDIQDGDEYRRGRKTVWKKWGKPQAINAGDAMQAMANIEISSLYKSGVNSGTVSAVSLTVNRAYFRMCEGQMMDIALEKKLRVSLAEYLDMIRCKTAVLIESAAYCGALLSTDDRKTTESFRMFGHYTGMAFQIFNDLCGFYMTQKPSSHIKSDLTKRKKTLPLVLALVNTRGSLRRALERIVKKPVLAKSDIAALMSLLKESGSVSQARLIGSSFLERASLEVRGLDIGSKNLDLLEEFIFNISC